MASPPQIDLSGLASSDDKNGAAILRVFSAVVSTTAAADLDKLYQAQKTDAVEDFLWSLWTLLIDTVKKVPAEDARQQLLVDMIAQLVKKRDDPVTLWGQETSLVRAAHARPLHA